jgi:riboflavin synthase
MFTGLVEEVGVVQVLEKRGQGGRLAVRAHRVLEGTRLGDSIAVSGACLTVVDLRADGFTVDCMPETLAHTTLGKAAKGALVNLERSMQMGGRLGGHLVLGHVDAVAEVLAVRPAGAAWEVEFSLPEAVRACIAAKGSVALDGISLTVIRVELGSFAVGIIPHTMKQTTLGSVKPGQTVNIEADVLARYVQRVLSVGQEKEDGGTSVSAGLTEVLLREEGFV